MSRFARHQLIGGFSQDRLRQARVLVVGAGAVGNEVLKNLALLGLGAIHVLDSDEIEESNLTRSVLFREGDIGQPKARVAAEACRNLYPEGRYSWCRSTFWQWASLERLRAFDAVVAATDNFESRLQLNQLCRLAPVDLFNAGIDARHVAIEAFPFRRNPGTACYECTLPESVYRDVRARYSCGGFRRAAALVRQVPTTAVTASHAGAWLVGALLNALCDHPDRPDGAFRQLLDTVNPLGSSAVGISRRTLCPGCSAPWPVRRFPCGSMVGDLKKAEWMREDRPVLTLSNPVVLGLGCRTCGDSRPLLAAAADCESSLLHCPHCRQDSIQPDVRSQLTPGQLQRLPPAARLPVKYATFLSASRTILIEINDHENV